MRIGLVTGEYPPMQGGIGAHCHMLASTLVQQGHDVSIFSRDGTTESNTNIALHSPIKTWNIGGLRQLNSWAMEQELDVINLHFQTAAFDMSPWIHFASRFVGEIPIITTFHDLRVPYLFPKAGKLRNWMVMHLARSSTAVIATNHEDFQQLASIPNKAIIPIGSSIPTQPPNDYNRDTWRNNLGLNEDAYLVAHFGFINHSKGIEHLLQATTNLLAEGIPIHLVMIGGTTGSSDASNVAYVNTVENQITTLDLNNKIFWTGYVDAEQVSAYLDCADVIALPFRDGASYRRSSLMAAIEHACAITTTQPTIPIPAFQHQENIWLVERDDTADLAKALRELYTSPERRDSLKSGTKQLRQHFDWDMIAEQHVQFFQTIIQSN